MGTHSGGRPSFVPGQSGREAAAGSAPGLGLAPEGAPQLGVAPGCSRWWPFAEVSWGSAALPLRRGCGLECALAAATQGLLNFKQQPDGRDARMNGQNAPPGFRHALSC